MVAIFHRQQCDCSKVVSGDQLGRPSRYISTIAVFGHSHLGYSNMRFSLG
jgi:hypothetical protein